MVKYFFSLAKVFSIDGATINLASRHETGGLSGPPIKSYTLSALKTLRANLPANIPIIGCGGISTGEDALEYARRLKSKIPEWESLHIVMRTYL